jgi:hypothetical protein
MLRLHLASWKKCGSRYFETAKISNSSLTEYGENKVSDINRESEANRLKLETFAEHTRAFLQIQNGCRILQLLHRSICTRQESQRRRTR